MHAQNRRRQAAALFAAAAAAAFSLFLGAAVSSGLDVPRLSGRVNDYGSMISPQARVELEAELADFERTDSTQVVVLTVPSLEGDAIEDFSIRVGDAWKIGQKGKDNGVLFIVAKADRKMRIEVGTGLQGTLTDLLAGRIIDTVVKPRFRENRFDEGFLEGARAIIAATRGEFKPVTAPRSSGSPESPGGFFEAFLVSVFVVLPFLRRISRFLPIPAGAAAGPLLYYLFFGAASVATMVLLAGGGTVIGMFLAAMDTGGGHGKHKRRGGGGGFWDASSWSGGSGFGGGFSSGSGGGFGGGFSGGGGGFNGGGSSGGW